MELQTPLEVPSPPTLAVPDAVYRQVVRSVRGVTTIAIDHEASPGKFRKVNGIKLRDRKTEIPEEDLFEIASLITSVLHDLWLQCGGEDPVRARVRCERPAQPGKPRGEQSRWQVTYTPTDSSEDEAIVQARDLQHEVYIETIDGLRRQLEQGYYHIDEAHGRILDLAQHMKEPISTAAQMLGLAGAMIQNALHAQVQLAQQQFDAKRVEIEEREKSRRSDRFWKHVTPYALRAADQLLKRYTGSGLDIEGLDEDMVEAADAAQGDQQRDEPAQEPAPEVEETDEMDTDDAIVLWTETLSETLTADQHERIAALPKAARTAIYKLLRSKTPQEARTAFRAVYTRHAMRLLELREHLTQDQGKLLEALFAAVMGDGDDGED